MLPAPADVATVCRSTSTGRLPARSSRVAPARPPRESRTEEIVTVRPLATSRPVPACRCPKSGVVYQSLYQGVPGWPEIANEARCGSSPSAVPAGPQAGTLAGTRTRGATSVGEGVAVGPDCAVLAWTLGVMDGAGPDCPAWVERWLVASAARWVLPTPEANL